MIKLQKTQKSKTILKNPPNKNAIFNRQHHVSYHISYQQNFMVNHNILLRNQGKIIVKNDPLFSANNPTQTVV